jgi:hypothetical protein
MDMPDQFRQVGVFFTKDRMITVSKQVPRAGVATIEADGISGQQSAHKGGQLGVMRADQKVKMNRHHQEKCHAAQCNARWRDTGYRGCPNVKRRA